MVFLEEDNRFYMNDDNGKMIAEVTFPSLPDHQGYVINHTFVDPSLRGQGIAAELIKAVVDKAKAEDMKIVPLCPYARYAFDNNPEYAELERPMPQ